MILARCIIAVQESDAGEASVMADEVMPGLENGRRFPGPDPTVLTTQQLLRELASLREIFETRLDGLDRIIGIMQEEIARFPEERKELAAQLEKVGQTRLDGLMAQIQTLDRRHLEFKEVTLDRLHAQKAEVAIALEAADKGINSAVVAAERAAAKAELAADKKYLESQIQALKETFTAQVASQRDAFTASMESQERAVSKAEMANEKRFEAVNEFRSTLEKQQQNFVVKSEVDYRIQALNDKIDILMAEMNASRGRGAGIGLAWAAAIGAIGVVGTATAIILGFS